MPSAYRSDFGDFLTRDTGRRGALRGGGTILMWGCGERGRPRIGFSLPTQISEEPEKTKNYL